MAIFVGPVNEHQSTDFHPPGIVDDSWCEMVSNSSIVDTLTIGALATSIRTPLLGSNVTYVALSQAQRDAAITAGAMDSSGAATFAAAFDSPPSHRGTYEP